ncbi:MAG: phosphoenolpyruvate---glycerone phosphotransferase subunit DhaL [Clostridiales bacterium]|nr:phosphoenolpyruvate---glycerone phosphotransferase subunit DhaL [Clostridiales bacterium]
MDRTFVIRLLEELKNVMQENKEYLIDLDLVVGDGDLGLTMSDGFFAAYEAAKNSSETDLGKLFYLAGKAMSTAVPSTMGTLMASGLMQAGKVLKGKAQMEAEDIATFFMAYEEGVMTRGKAKIGEKTFLDGIDPAITAIKSALLTGNDLVETAKRAELAAKKGYEQTATMLAVHGRAATRGEASRALKDPGAYVAYLMMSALVRSVS